MKMHQYTATWFEVDGGGNSRAKYEAGHAYPVTEETTKHWGAGIAVEIDVADPAPEAPPADPAPDAPAP